MAAKNLSRVMDEKRETNQMDLRNEEGNYYVMPGEHTSRDVRDNRNNYMQMTAEGAVFPGVGMQDGHMYSTGNAPPSTSSSSATHHRPSTSSAPDMAASASSTSPQDRSSILKPEENPVVWPHQAVLLLLETRRDHRHQLTSNLYKKVQVWENISAVMVENGYNYSGLACDKKWRGLVQRYRIVKDRDPQFSQGKTQWRYFNLMDEIITNEQAEPDAPVTQTPSGNTTPGGPVTDGQSTWPHEAVLLLVKTRREFLSQLTSPMYKKTQVWEKIAAVMAEQGHVYSGLACDKKWRALVHRYKYNRHRDEIGQGKTQWKYYNLMEETLVDDPTFTPYMQVPSPSGMTDDYSDVDDGDGGPVPSPGSASSGADGPPSRKKRKRDPQPQWLAHLTDRFFFYMDRIARAEERKATALERLAGRREQLEAEFEGEEVLY